MKYYSTLIASICILTIMPDIICCQQSNATKNISTSPSPRSGYMMTYDLHRDVVILFGGQDSINTKLGDTWEWSKGNWSKINIESPSQRINGAMAYDSDRRITFLFGGLSSSGLENDLWQYDGIVWKRIETTNAPPALQLATMVYDKVHSRFVLFGGMETKRKVLSDTWILEQGKWSRLISVGRPFERACHSMAYNPVSGTVFMHGGYSDSTLSDLWELKNNNWSQVFCESGPFRLHASMDFDPVSGKLFLFGGFDNDGRTNELWTYNGSKWEVLNSKKKLAPEPRAEHEVAFIPGKGLFLFGGVVGKDPKKRTRSNDSWLFTNKWNKKY